ncbi:MAG: cobalt ABC transporter ATP-binding protein [Actinomycetales bacterium mxb001]|nr:MAG: cobalt ABC transporter ATP-binding protein [Actinomycetales bacterium mxb001]
MIRFDHVTITYDGAQSPALVDTDLRIDEGELVLVVGRTGSGKSTFLRAINGLVPHFTGGTLHGRVIVDGRDTATHHPRDLADVVGMVPQDPMSSFVTDTVEEELAYSMECLGIDPGTMRRRVEETLDLLGLADVRDRPLLSLSGGQRQRVAIGSVLTAHPRVLVLDEPTSALDPGAAEEVLATLQRLVHDLGVTVVMAEHRLERVLEYADRIIVIPGDGRSPIIGEPAPMMRLSPVAPPVVHLGRLVQWEPLPLSVRDARRQASSLRDRLSDLADDDVPTTGARVVSIDRTRASYGPIPALRGITLDVSEGEVIALMGRNGAGKSTLLSTLVGLRRPDAGTVRIAGLDPATLRGPKLIGRIGLVPQDSADLISRDTVAAECRDADRDAGCAEGSTAALLAELAPEIDSQTHPRDLSEGQRLTLALAIVLVAQPAVLLLDEPTRGLDYPTKARLASILRDLAQRGHAVVIATHDVELAADVATRVVVLADGEVVADGPTPQVVVGSPLFAPQVAKVLATRPGERVPLTVPAVAAALGVAG